MPEALSSFLLSVSIILAIVLFVPCIESLVRVLRRGSQKGSLLQGEAAKVFSRDVIADADLF